MSDRLAVDRPLDVRRRDDRFDADAGRYLPALFLASAGYVALIALPTSTVSVGVAGGALVAATLYARSASRRSGRSLRRTVGRVAETPVYGELVAVAVVVLVGYPFVGFPTPTPDGPRVNIYVHFLGYALAYTTVHLSLLADRTGSLWGPADAG